MSRKKPSIEFHISMPSSSAREARREVHDTLVDRQRRSDDLEREKRATRKLKELMMGRGLDGFIEAAKTDSLDAYFTEAHESSTIVIVLDIMAA